MQFDFQSNQPLFQQINDEIEDAILQGAFPEGEQVPSTTEISRNFQINPATVLKGMNLLVDHGFLQKKRGIGMFVSIGAQAKIREIRKEKFLNEQINQLVRQAKELGIDVNELKQLIERRYEK
jgi:DNA-binding transcriptional regulator YhcF (GntR family)